MKRIRFAQIGMGLLATLGLTSEAMAGGRNPGSLLLYPEFDNRYGVATVVTVTNANPMKDVNVHFIYVGRYGHGYPPEYLDCEEFDRDHDLTPNDTLTFTTYDHNPQQEQGYLYVYARGEDSDLDTYHEAIGFDWLIGNLLVVDGLDTFEYSINPVSFMSMFGEGEATDDDGDGIRDLDGIEYEKAPREIQIPRFLGQGERLKSELILIGLSGGSEYTTTANFTVYNDDEDAFSEQYTFRCWTKVKLTQVGNVFSNEFLKYFSGDNEYKKLGDRTEYGWYRIRGGNAHAGACSISDACVYGVHIEVVNYTAAADLPFEDGECDGHLLPRLLSGDNSENPDGCF